MPPLRRPLLVGLHLLLCLCSIVTSAVLCGLALSSQSGQNMLLFGIHSDRQLTTRRDRYVRMMVEDSVRYRHPNEEASLELAHGFPPGGGAIPLETTNNHAMFLSMYHQLDCIDTLGHELTGTSRTRWTRLQHCMNYLREMAICDADMTVEPGDFTHRNFSAERTGAVHVCRDWTNIYDSVADNWARWKDVREQIKASKHE